MARTPVPILAARKPQTPAPTGLRLRATGYKPRAVRRPRFTAFPPIRSAAVQHPAQKSVGRRGFYRLRKNSGRAGVLKGARIDPCRQVNQQGPALAAGGWFSSYVAVASEFFRSPFNPRKQRAKPPWPSGPEERSPQFQTGIELFPAATVRSPQRGRKNQHAQIAFVPYQAMARQTMPRKVRAPLHPCPARLRRSSAATSPSRSRSANLSGGDYPGKSPVPCRLMRTYLDEPKLSPRRERAFGGGAFRMRHSRNRSCSAWMSSCCAQCSQLSAREIRMPLILGQRPSLPASARSCCARDRSC